MTALKKAEPKNPKRRILLVDDHAIVRTGFAEIINGESDLQVCGQASSAPSAVEAITRLKPDAVVVDLSLQSGSGLELIKNLKALHPRLAVLVLSMHDEALYAERALRAGALGYVMKREEAETVIRAIRSVLRGEVYLSASLRGRFLHKLVGSARQVSASGVAQLSDRELEIFETIGEGLTTREIAQKLHLSVSTVETHRAHIKEKLALRNAAELARAAVEWAAQH
jgi:DNA-binding NarL/FixJ family response regulator